MVPSLRTWPQITNVNSPESPTIDELDPIKMRDSLEEIIFISTKLKGNERRHMVELLKNNKKAFTW